MRSRRRCGSPRQRAECDVLILARGGGSLEDLLGVQRRSGRARGVRVPDPRRERRRPRDRLHDRGFRRGRARADALGGGRARSTGPRGNAARVRRARAPRRQRYATPSAGAAAGAGTAGTRPGARPSGRPTAPARAASRRARAARCSAASAHGSSAPAPGSPRRRRCWRGARRPSGCSTCRHGSRRRDANSWHRCGAGWPKAWRAGTGRCARCTP